MSPNNSIKAIIFDFGGVLVDWDPRNLYQAYFPNQPEALNDFLEEVGFAAWNARQDGGRSFAEGVAELSARFPHRAELIRAYAENWTASIRGEIAGTVEILYELKAQGYPLYGLSNWSAETFPLVKDEYAFFKEFDKIIISGEVKLIKPDPAIYRLLLQHIQRPAAECLFIDDSPVNIAAAKELGFQTHRFQSPKALVDDLQERLPK